MSTFVSYDFEHDLNTSNTSSLLADIISRLGNLPLDDDRISPNGLYLNPDADKPTINYYDHGIRITLHITEKHLHICYFPLELRFLPYDLIGAIKALQGSKAKDFSTSSPPNNFLKNFDASIQIYARWGLFVYNFITPQIIFHEMI